MALSDIDPALVGALGGDSVLFPDSGNGGYEVTLVDLTLVLSDDLGAIDGVAVTTANATQDLQRFYSEGGTVAANRAVHHPERVEKLVLYSCTVYGAGLASEAFRRSFVEIIRALWGVGSKVMGLVKFFV